DGGRGRWVGGGGIACLRSNGGGGAARGLEGVREGAAAPAARPDRVLRRVRRRRRGCSFHRRGRRAGGREGRRPGGGEGRLHLPHGAGGEGGGGPDHASAAVRGCR